jgi:Holliday junction resolvase RusA-like endonuclease
MSRVITIPLTPVPYVRQTRFTNRKHPPLSRYRHYKRDLALLWLTTVGVLPSCGLGLTFELPMPKSWSQKKRDRMTGQPHQQKPDLDNLLKAWADALYADDSRIWEYLHLRKRWAETGAIVVTLEEPTR